jgi:hypothetical protein
MQILMYLLSVVLSPMGVDDHPTKVVKKPGETGNALARSRANNREEDRKFDGQHACRPCEHCPI